MNTLVRYDWPGNIRELQNVIERAVIVATGPVLKVPLDDLRSRVPAAQISNGGSTSEDAGKMRGVLEEAERGQILVALKQTNWIVAGPKGAASLLGMKRSTLQAHCRGLAFGFPAPRLSRVPAIRLPAGRLGTCGGIYHRPRPVTFIFSGRAF